MDYKLKIDIENNNAVIISKEDWQKTTKDKNIFQLITGNEKRKLHSRSNFEQENT